MLVPLRSVTRLLVALPRTTLTASPAAVLAAHWTPPPLELETNSQVTAQWEDRCYLRFYLHIYFLGYY
jgi:hypothetical protein